ncbi:MAG: GAF domain-containing protein [Gammaproteobacteria bacterium]|nr:GAF domain-containing protein [Gammaproteobacteria bacterium]
MTANLETIDFGHDAAAKARGYRELQDALRALLAGECDAIANLANTAALLYGNLPQLNWAGFYLLTRNDNAVLNDTAAKEELVLGPFQGKPACVRIALGRGVCGTTAARRVTTVVPNVHEFPGHIACDSASISEIVVPMIVNEGPHKGSLLGVLDLDSPMLARFDDIDREGLERVVEVLVSSTSWP